MLGRWDVDRMLSEMDAETFDEWMAFSLLEPLDPAGAILQGFTGPAEERVQPKPPGNWMNQKIQMLQWMNIFGKKKKE